MNKNKSESTIEDKEIGKKIATEFFGEVIQSVLNYISQADLSEYFSDINMSAIAINPVQDPETKQIRVGQVKVGINLSFK